MKIVYINVISGCNWDCNLPNPTLPYLTYFNLPCIMLIKTIARFTKKLPNLMKNIERFLKLTWTLSFSSLSNQKLQFENEIIWKMHFIFNRRKMTKNVIKFSQKFFRDLKKKSFSILYWIEINFFLLLLIIFKIFDLNWKLFIVKAIKITFVKIMLNQIICPET